MSEPSTETNPLTKRDRESVRAHRSFLLWAMQEGDRRSTRAAGRAVGRSESTAREWRNRWDWVNRASDPLSEVKAQGVYRELYYPEYKLREIVEIEDRMAAPFMPDTPVSSSVAESVAEAIKPETRKDKEQARERKAKQRHVSLIDAALGYVAQQLQANEIRASLRDVPMLLRMRQELTGELLPQDGSFSVVESVRVKAAKANGDDVLDAMHADAIELTAILGALQAAKSFQASGEKPAVRLEEATA